MTLVPDQGSFSAVAPGSQNQFWGPIPATVQDFSVCIFEIRALPAWFILCSCHLQKDRMAKTTDLEPVQASALPFTNGVTKASLTSLSLCPYL